MANLRPDISYFILSFSTGLAEGAYGSYFVIYFLSLGLNLGTIGVLQLVFFLTLALLDFPTGGFADVRGRRLCLVLGFSGISGGYLAFSTGIIPLLFTGSFLCAIGTSMISGTLEAWLVDEIGDIRNEDVRKEVGRIFGVGDSLFTLGSLLSGPVGWILAMREMRLVFLFAGMVSAGQAILSSLLNENYGSRRDSYLRIMKDSLRFISSSPTLKLYFIAYSLSQIWFANFILTWQPALVEFGLRKEMLGLIYSILMSIMGSSSYLAGRIMKKISPGFLVISMGLLASASLMLVPLGRSLLFSLISFFLLEVAIGMGSPAGAAWRNEFIPHEMRASLISALSTAASLTAGVYYWAGGSLAEAVGIPNSFLLASFSALLSSMVFAGAYITQKDVDLRSQIEYKNDKLKK